MRAIEVVTVGIDFRKKEMHAFSKSKRLVKISDSKLKPLLSLGRFPNGPLTLVSSRLENLPSFKKLQAVTSKNGSKLVIAADAQEAGLWLQTFLKQQDESPPAKKRRKKKVVPKVGLQPPEPEPQSPTHSIKHQIRLVALAMAGYPMPRELSYGFVSTLGRARNS